jgi:hypothetical protein
MGIHVYPWVPMDSPLKKSPSHSGQPRSLNVAQVGSGCGQDGPYDEVSESDLAPYCGATCIGAWPHKKFQSSAQHH